MKSRPKLTNEFSKLIFDDISETSSDELAPDAELPPLFKDPNRIAMARALRRNGGRPRENLDQISDHLCKDQEGNWTKWVLARCTESERLAYAQMSEMCSKDPVTSHVTENHKLRYLNGFKFDPVPAYKALVDAEETRFKFCCDDLS